MSGLLVCGTRRRAGRQPGGDADSARRPRRINVRGAWLHVLSDTLGSLQTIIAGILIWAYGLNWVDPMASVLTALLVLWSSWTLLRDSVSVLLEGAPRHLDTRDIDSALRAVPRVEDLHDLHVWTITSGFVALSVHVVASAEAPEDLLVILRDVLASRFEIDHSTIQVEVPSLDPNPS